MQLHGGLAGIRAEGGGVRALPEAPNMSDARGEAWPRLEWDQWAATADTLHMWTQIVGKTRLGLTPVQNHWWNVPLYVSARGLTTSAMPLPQGGVLDIEFDFIAHELEFRSCFDRSFAMPLRAQSVADFYAAYLEALETMSVAVHINPMPVELKDPIRFDRDTVHQSYDPDAARRFWHVLRRADALFKRFSCGFLGKISPVHFFWGSFDLAVTRFNGRRAPSRPGADAIQAEAYSHECISAGFWPGNGGYGQAAFYCYAAPVPDGLAAVKIPGDGAFNRELGEFLLNYDEVRRAADPDQAVLEFLAATYAAGADAARWDRGALER
jgi:hypothetical protein